MTINGWAHGLVIGSFLFVGTMFVGYSVRQTEREYVDEKIVPALDDIGLEWIATEKRLEGDNVRVDIETRYYAIEVDFSRKWAEAVGQSLYYAHLTGKRPGIVLIGDADSTTEVRHYGRCVIAGARAGVRVWFYDRREDKLR